MLAHANYWLPQVFNEMFNNDFMMPRTVSMGTPAINVIEHKDSYEVQIAAPGMTREDFKLTLDADQNLVIEVEKKTETCDKPVEAKDDNAAATDDKENKPAECKNTDRYLRREFTYTKFRQTFSLPDDVDHDAISASAQDGVLTIAMPKLQPQTKEIKVKEIAIA